jgi:uncharacterized delta-60 repeat protein
MKHYYLFWLLLGLILPGHAQSLDPAFQPTALFNQSANAVVVALAAQADGKVLAAGNFQAAGGVLSNNVLRLNADLSRDLSFRPALGANGLVQALAVQPDGKVLIGGLFTGYAGTTTGPVARLLPTGELDPTFQPDPALLGGQVAALAVQADGSVLVGGTASASLPGGLVRLLPSGGLDPAFGVGSGAGSGKQVLALAVQPADGGIVVGGSFASFNGRGSQSLVRLLPSGGLDPSFTPPSYAAGTTIASVAILPTGTILAGGGTGTASGGNLRGFLPNGVPDARFTLNFTISWVRNIQVDAAGRVLVVGGFNYISGSYTSGTSGALRLLADGTLDPTFTPQYPNSPYNPSAYYYSVLPLPDGRVLLGGYVLQATVLSLVAVGVAAGLNLLSATGVADPTFNLGLQLRGSVSQVVPQTDGALLLRGSYSTLNGQAVSGQLQRLGADGRLVQDRQLPALPAASRESLTYSSLFPQPDGQVYAVVVSRICIGSCGTPEGHTQYTTYLRRIRADNTLDPDFNVLLFGNNPFSSLPAATVQQLTVSSTGDLLVLFNPPAFLASSDLRLLRIQPTGTAQAITPSGFLSPVNAPPGSGLATPQLRQVVPQPDGKLLVSYDLFTYLTSFPTLTSTSQRNLARLLPDGRPDPDFAVAASPVPANVALTLGPLQADGKCFVSGAFTSFAGVPAPTGLVRLLPSGAVDATFQPAASLAPLVPQALLPDGRLLVQANSQLSSARLRCLLPDGAADASFAPVAVTSAGYPTSSWGVVLQPGDHKPVLFGDFTEVAGQPRTGLARLSVASPLAVRVGSGGGSPLSLYPNPAHQRVTLVLPTTPKQASTVQLYDALGREVGRQPVPAHATELMLSLTGLPPGLYLLRCGAAMGQLIVN